MRWWARGLTIAALVVGFSAQMALAGPAPGHAASCIGNPGPCDGPRALQPSACLGNPGPCDGPRVSPPQAVPIVVAEYDGTPVTDLPTVNGQPYVPTSAPGYEARLTAEFCEARPELC